MIGLACSPCATVSSISFSAVVVGVMFINDSLSTRPKVFGMFRGFGMPALSIFIVRFLDAPII
mgnify:CR=1 FL=1